MKYVPKADKIENDRKPFVWLSEHQTACDVLKVLFTMVQMIGYTDLSKMSSGKPTLYLKV